MIFLKAKVLNEGRFPRWQVLRKVAFDFALASYVPFFLRLAPGFSTLVSNVLKPHKFALDCAL